MECCCLVWLESSLLFRSSYDMLLVNVATVKIITKKIVIEFFAISWWL